MKSIRILGGLLCLSLTARAAGVNLSGQVTTSNGKPLAKAAVFVSTAGPKTGTSSFCPSCYPDCTKKAQTDAQGRFEIPSLDEALIFRLLAVAEGYQSEFVTKVDPIKGETRISLEPLSAEEMNSPLRVKGIVIGENGLPIANATIAPEGIGIGTSTRWGPTGDFTDSVAVSDEHGHFVLHCKTNVDSIYALAEGRGVAQKWVTLKPAGDYAVRLEEGVTVTGRIVHHGEPLPMAAVGLSTTERRAGSAFGCGPIATGADGRFLIPSVPSGQEYSFYVRTESLGGRGVVPRKVVKTANSKTTLDLGDIAVAPAVTVEGRIELSDGKAIPPGTRLLVSRDGTGDATQQELGPDGSFKVSAVAAESIGVTVRVKGYKFSKRNPSLDWLNGGIVGKVDRNLTGLTLLMEPGQWEFNNHPDDAPPDGELQPRGKPLRGVANGATSRN